MNCFAKLLLWQDNCFIQKAEDAEELQASLDRMCAWTENWGMAFNIEKCHVMHIGLHNPKLNYHMNGKSLSKTENERDIGVMVSNNLKPAQQCRKAAQTASAVLGQITRDFHYRDRHVFLSLYQQYVRWHLEFAVAAWPHGQEQTSIAWKMYKGGQYGQSQGSKEHPMKRS